MKTIYKYVFHTSMELPRGAEVLTIDYQEQILTMWCLVDTDAEIQQRYFLVLPTGHIGVDETINKKYIKTVFQSTGHVWHIFEVDLEN